MVSRHSPWHLLAAGLALTDNEVALVKLKQGAIACETDRDDRASAAREEVTDASLSNGQVPTRSISFSAAQPVDGRAARGQEQGDTKLIVELLGG